jgi:hypothetical protein
MLARDEIPLVPFFGGKGVAPSTTPDQLADWVKQEDRIPLLLALSLYTTPIETLQDYTLIPNTNITRAAAWFSTITGKTIIGTRGTSLFQKYGHQDIQDDKVSGAAPVFRLSAIFSSLAIRDSSWYVFW